MFRSKSYIQENKIYEYMHNRFIDNKLNLYQVVKDGEKLKKRKLVNVDSLEIKDTLFPDVNEITINGDVRQAEVKFRTSSFNYHVNKNYIKKFGAFRKNKGCIIVIEHDELPANFPKDFSVDVYQIDRDDFSTFIKENHEKFLNRQLGIKEKSNIQTIWLTSQSVNFHGKVSKKKDNMDISILPANKTGIWSPFYRSQINEIEVNDKAVFVKFSGVDKQHAKENDIVNHKWILDEIYITKVKRIESRNDYCLRKGLKEDAQLWIDDKETFSSVFEFEKQNVIRPMINIHRLPPKIIDIFLDIYRQPGMREIGQDLYNDILEHCFNAYTNRSPLN